MQILGGLLTKTKILGALVEPFLLELERSIGAFSSFFGRERVRSRDALPLVGFRPLLTGYVVCNCNFLSPWWVCYGAFPIWVGCG